ncbi:phytochelatin synthase family protein [bacterium]|nr:phytochelatin synthase family protein [bacterium]
MARAFLFLALIVGSQATADLVDWSSQEGIHRLERSKHKVDFFKLANHFESQRNRLYCGPTTGIILLNAFRLGKEGVAEDETTFEAGYKKYLPKGMSPFFPKYTQNTFFSSAKQGIKSEAAVCGEPPAGKPEEHDFGFQLRQYDDALKAHGLKTTLRIVTDGMDSKTIRAELIQNLKTPGDFVVVNYARSGMGQKGGGHISPLGAYDAQSDSFLVLDVNPNSAPWVWAPADTLISAMRTKDTVENRGYILVQDK